MQHDACLGQLLDNGTVNAKSQCGRFRLDLSLGASRGAAFRRKHPINAIPHVDLRLRAPATCKLPRECEVTLERRLSDFVSETSHRFAGLRRKSEVSMESLILAQDERWRHA